MKHKFCNQLANRRSYGKYSPRYVRVIKSDNTYLKKKKKHDTDLTNLTRPK